MYIFIYIYIYGKSVNPLLSAHPLLSTPSNKCPPPPPPPLEKKKFNKRLPLIRAPSNKRPPPPHQRGALSRKSL